MKLFIYLLLIVVHCLICLVSADKEHENNIDYLSDQHDIQDNQFDYFDEDETKTDMKTKVCAEYESKLFKPDSPKLSPIEFLAAIEQYESQGVKCRSVWPNKYLVVFYDIKTKCNLKSISCGPSGLKAIDSLLIKHSDLRNTVVPLLHHCRQQIAGFCIKKQTEEILTVVNHKLTSEDKAKLTLLKDKVLDKELGEVTKPYIDLPVDRLALGLVQYVKDEEKSLLTLDSKTFPPKFERLITNYPAFCYKIWSDGPYFTYTLRYDDSLFILFDPQVQEWLTNFNICSKIVEKKSKLTKTVFKLLH